MSTGSILSTKLDHFTGLQFQEEKFHNLQPDPRHIEALLNEGNFFSYSKNYRIKAIAGYRYITNYRVNVYAIFSDDIDRSSYLAVYRKMKAVVNTLKADRIELHVLEGYETGERFAKSLGFKHEALLRKYMFGFNYNQYCLIKD